VGVGLPELIYIDLNHWVGLSKARIGQAGSELYAEALAELRTAVSSGRAVVPISFPHYIEISQIASAQRRANIALTMGELSKYTALTPREVFLHYQFRQSLAQELGTSYASPRPAITGHGFGHAVDYQPLKGRLRGDATALEQLANNLEDFIPRLEAHTGFGWKFAPSGTAETPFELLNEALDAHAQFRMLMGPADKQDAELLRHGFNPSVAYDVVETMTRREADLAQQLAAEPIYQRQLDDIIAARALRWDLWEDWDQAVSDVWPRTVTIEELGWTRVSRILRSIPIVDIESSIRRANFRNGSYRWKKNDIHDLGFSGPAVTYCEVLFTERHLRTQLCRQSIDRKYGTTVLSHPEELVAYLRQSKALGAKG
jgi:hypothetical protein